MLIFLTAVGVVLIVSFLCSIFESVLLSVTRPQIEVLGRRHARAARPRKPRQKPNVGFAADSTPSSELPPPLAAPDDTTLLSRRGEPSRSLVAPLSPRCARISSNTCPSRPCVSPCRLPLRAPRYRTCTASAPARCGCRFHPRRIGLRQSPALFGAGGRAPIIVPLVGPLPPLQ